MTRPPADGRTAFAGYANIKSVMRRKSFFRVSLTRGLVTLEFSCSGEMLGTVGRVDLDTLAFVMALERALSAKH